MKKFTIIQAWPPFDEYTLNSNESKTVESLFDKSQWEEIIDYSIPLGGIEYRYVTDEDVYEGGIFDNIVVVNGHAYETDGQLYSFLSTIYQSRFTNK